MKRKKGTLPDSKMRVVVEDKINYSELIDEANWKLAWQVYRGTGFSELGLKGFKDTLLRLTKL